jgi:tetratricopeptide (TPR) repeat protein
MGNYENAETNLKKAIENNKYDSKAHVELGNLFLQTERIKDAIKEFRRAISVDTSSEEAVRALSIALMQIGDYRESEKTLREGIRRLEEFKRWQLHLTLSRLLVCMGDETSEKAFYEEALKEVNEAIKLRPDHPDPYFYAGIVRSKLKDYWRAKRSFSSCLRRDKNYFEAERNIRIIDPLIYEELFRSKVGIVGALLLDLSQ